MIEPRNPIEYLESYDDLDEASRADVDACVARLETVALRLFEQLIAVADEENFDRDDVLKYFADMLSAVCEVSTFRQYKRGEEDQQ